MTATAVMLAFLLTALAPTALADPGNGNGAGQEKETNGKSSDTQGKKDNEKQGAGKGKKDRAACDDGQDNDGDGKTDFPDDPGCSSKGDDDETDPTPPPSAPQCSDGVDNDGDGFADYPADLGCMRADQDAEGCSGWQNFNRYLPGTHGSPWVDPLCFVDDPSQVAACGDGKDNDGDGKTDYPDDPGCAMPLDQDETDTPSPECSDGVDNDGDGQADFGADPDCTGPGDGTEACSPGPRVTTYVWPVFVNAEAPTCLPEDVLTCDLPVPPGSGWGIEGAACAADAATRTVGEVFICFDRVQPPFLPPTPPFCV